MSEAQRSTLLIALVFSVLFSTFPVEAQLLRPGVESKSSASSKSADLASPRVGPQTSPTATRSMTISDAVSIFLKQNFQLIAARYDIDTADAEKLTARLRPNPEVSV